MENQKKRGRPSKPKVDMDFALEENQKKRGRKAVVKINTEVDLSSINPEMGAIEQLKHYVTDINKLDNLLNSEPYRMDMRMKRQEIINNMCFIIKNL